MPLDFVETVKRASIDKQLSNFRNEPVPELSDSFAEKVLDTARRLKRAAIIHRRFLIAATVIAVGISFSLGLFSSKPKETAPPVSAEFQTNSGFDIPVLD